MTIDENPNEYNPNIDAIRAAEYPQLENQVYLDHAGMTLYSKSLVTSYSKYLLENLIANPHSQSLASQKATNVIEEVKYDLLTSVFHADPSRYSVVFTLNATNAAKLLAEGFEDTFGKFEYLYSADSHTSLVGIRERSDKWFCFKDDNECVPRLAAGRPTLVSWTAQSNFNGERYPIQQWNDQFKHTDNVYTCLDASSLCSTSPPDLTENCPDFVVCSLYKIFGLPDLGCLIFDNECGRKVFSGRRYFGGGTVDALAPDVGFVKRKEILSETLQDGTLPIHSIIQLQEAMKSHFSIYGSFEKISKHVTFLSLYGVTKLGELKHNNGVGMVKIYGKIADYGNSTAQGPIIAMSLKDRNNNDVGYYEFEKHVSMERISIRTGTVCNIGGVNKWLEQTNEEIISNNVENNHKCGDNQDMIHGKLTGVIRLSFGAMSNKKDIDFFCQQVENYFENNLVDIENQQNHTNSVTISKLVIYPVKSCAGYEIPRGISWQADEKGLNYDRLFCLVDLNNRKKMLLKNNPNMTKIKPEIDNVKNTMTLSYGKDEICIKLDHVSTQKLMVDGELFDCVLDKVLTGFLSEILNKPCILAKSADSHSLQNTSSFLLMNQSSIHNLSQSVSVKESIFRSNMIVSHPDLIPYEEDNWKGLKIGGSRLQVVSKCERCHMITIDPDTGARNSEVYKRLNAFRKFHGKIYFAVNLNIVGHSKFNVKVGDVMEVEY